MEKLETPKPKKSSVQSKTILVVEDDEDLNRAIADMLRRENFLSFEAKNGKEGVEIALTKHPDLILLDLLMPVMGGLTALKNIRADAWGKKVPVIILTNFNQADDRITTDYVTYQPEEYLVKSEVKLRDVINKIKDILKVQ